MGARVSGECARASEGRKRVIVAEWLGEPTGARVCEWRVRESVGGMQASHCRRVAGSANGGAREWRVRESVGGTQASHCRRVAGRANGRARV
jgi:hypothetical protein